MKKLTTYQTLCTEYYDLHKPVLPDAEWQFYLSYATEAQGTILEPMCGTGHFFIPLLKAGFTIEGFDASEPMLARLVERCTEQSLVPTVWFGFIEDLAIKDRYALAFIPVGSFNLISEFAAVQISLKALYHCLLPGGKLVLELMTPALAEQLEYGDWIDAEYEREDGKTIMVKTLCQPMVESIVPVVRRYLLNDDLGKTEQLEIEEYALRFYMEHEFVTLLQDAGFATVNTVKAFKRGTSPDAQDPLVIYECTK